MSSESTKRSPFDSKEGALLERRKVPRPGILPLADFRNFVCNVPKATREISCIGIRQAVLSDLSQLLKIEEATWSEDARASAEMLASRIEVFPEGVLCATVDNRILGFACWEIIIQTPDEIRGSWADLTDHGLIKETHTHNGLTLFGVSLSILPEAPNGTIWTISEAAKKLTIRRGLAAAALGSRIPRYHQLSEKMDAETYIRQFKTGRHFDPELNLYKRIGLMPVRVLPNFFPDPASCNYGVLVQWRNPFKGIRDQLNVWEEYRWFDLWEHRIRRRQRPWQT